MNPFSWVASELRVCLTSPKRVLAEYLLVTNLTRHTVLATCMELANTSLKRNKGLLGR
jgi:hypothetical protein